LKGKQGGGGHPGRGLARKEESPRDFEISGKGIEERTCLQSLGGQREKLERSKALETQPCKQLKYSQPKQCQVKRIGGGRKKYIDSVDGVRG